MFLFLGGTTSFEPELPANLVNPFEKKLHSISAGEDTEWDLQHRREHTLRIGDLAFEALGQIVGRPYHYARSKQTDFWTNVINSPIESKELRDQVRALWASENPRQRLFDSLLADYATQSISKSGRDFSPFGHGAAELQVNAARRLLRYFPEEVNADPKIKEALEAKSRMRYRKDARS
jgi:hypothetical protein